MFDAFDNLIACHHGLRLVSNVRILDGGRLFHVACKRNFEGDLLNSPNDLDIDQDGNIYFTDPRYGNRDSMEMDVEGVYFQAAVLETEPDDEWAGMLMGTLARIIDDLTRPNGIVLSPDESILYVADHGTNEIFAYDVESPPARSITSGSSPGSTTAKGRRAGRDVCRCAQGRLYAAGQGKVWVYNPDGSAAVKHQRRPRLHQLHLRQRWQDPLHHRQPRAVRGSS